MKKIIIILGFIFAFILTSEYQALAGGPLVVKGAMPITYGTRPFLYRYDKGTLGMFSNQEAIDIIEPLYMNWQAVPTGEIKFQRDNPGSLDFDVTASNFNSILNSPDLLGYTPVIFDNDGKLLDAFLGNGAGSSVLGLSGPVTVNSGPLVNQIAESQAIFNGRFVNGINSPSDPESSVDSLKGTIIHETGHGIGLDHTQINLEAIKPGATQAIRDAVPLMFPVAVNDLFIIRRDDASAVSFLYPNISELTKFGKIEGRVLRQDGKTPVQGANIIAKNINDPKLEAISCVSDFLTDGTGSFTLFAVPPGTYTIEIEPVDLSFTGGSGVGPYTTSTTDKSFQNPVPKGFYIGPNKSIVTDESKALRVTVAAGQTVSNVDIIGSTTVSGSSSSTSSSGSTSISEQEPNNTVAQAQLITLPTTISGSVSSTDTGEVELASETGSMVIISDLFKFTLSQRTSLSALLHTESDLETNDLDLVLLNGDASKIIDSSSQTGNVDELISLTLNPGSYIVGVGAFMGSSSYKLEISTTSSNGSPTLTLTGSDTLVIKPGAMNQATLTATAQDFMSVTTCMVFSSNTTLVKLKPKTFTLSSNGKKGIRVKVPKLAALDLISKGSSKVVTVNVTCQNGASHEIDLTITPNVDSVINRKARWSIINKK